jgi:hypothetical protein
MKVESLPDSMPCRGKGRRSLMDFRASRVQSLALFLTALSSVHPALHVGDVQGEGSLLL